MIKRNGLPRKFVVTATLGVIIIGMIFLFFPFGYTLQEDGHGMASISENGILRNDFKVEVTEANALKIALLKSAIKEFKTICLMLVIIIPLLLLSIAINYVRKSKETFLIMCIITIIMLITSIILYFNNLEIMEHLISGLKEQKK
ncbi:hypothetical protein WAX74_14480 [Psychrobacillus sp. FJAT-51614]|uniref:Uncharacterized protein n=1 Tax=Psychrobacillus mangrovi TaxID=3117745 RepID=A0ABU8F750_9BACI